MLSVKFTVGEYEFEKYDSNVDDDRDKSPFVSAA